MTKANIRLTPVLYLDGPLRPYQLWHYGDIDKKSLDGHLNKDSTPYIVYDLDGIAEVKINTLLGWRWCWTCEKGFIKSDGTDDPAIELIIRKLKEKRHKPGAVIPVTKEEFENRKSINLSFPSSDPFSTQIGGSHYKDYKIQPYKFFHANRIPHHKASIMQRILRYDHSTGKGLEDLNKIKHEVDLIIKLEYKEGEQP